MPYLNWISDKALVRAVRHLIGVASAAQSKSLKTFNKNVIDPFSAIFQVAGFDMSHDDWVLSEQTRQSQKTLQNHIGDFHQIVLGSVDGWQNLETGQVMDLLSEKRRIIAEIKNKHNTVKGSDLSGLYRSMENAVSPKASIYKGYTAYYVTVIPKRPERFNIPFVPSDKEKGQRLPENSSIRLIDGASFYTLVTGESNALFDLFNCLPIVLEAEMKIVLSDEDIVKLGNYLSVAYGL